MALALVAAPALAAKPTTSGKAGAAKVQGPKAPKSSIGAKTTKAPKATPANAKAPKAGQSAKAAKTTAPKAATANATNESAGDVVLVPGFAGGPWAPNNPVSQKLSTKPNLLARVTRLLPAGTDLNAATAGFKNFGQFIAATNVSTNLGIDFSRLKAAMTGTDLHGVPTGQPTTSLGQAIQRLKPGVDGTVEASRAEKLADQQIASSGNQ